MNVGVGITNSEFLGSNFRVYDSLTKEMKDTIDIVFIVEPIYIPHAVKINNIYILQGLEPLVIPYMINQLADSQL